MTGATGSIGAHTLFELLNDDSVSTVFCLTRRTSPLQAVLRSLAEKDLHVSAGQASKIMACTTSLDQSDLGIGNGTILHRMQTSVSLIIHTAWPVNFNLGLAQFEPHIRGLHHLIQFSLSVHRSEPAVLMFCSSISTALGTSSAEIPESPIGLDSALSMGYGQSKLAAEHIVNIARHSGARTFSLRIGQVSGHSKKGLWNDSEALPLMVRSALTLHALPDLRQTCSWLPVDQLASSIIELTKACSALTREREESHASSSASVAYVDDSVYNLCNPREFDWSSLLASLKLSGFQFDTVPFETWLQMLRESEARGEEQANPAVKLIDHYEAMYGGKSVLAHHGPKKFCTGKAERDSLTLRNGRLRIVEDGILNCYARDWLTRWTTA